MGKLLEVKDLTIEIHTDHGTVYASRGVSFELNEDETLCIVGESGSGKSITVKGIMGLLPKTAEIVSGSVMFQGKDLTKIPEKEMLSLRGQDISMIFQDPMTSLNPTMTVGEQIMEVLREHRKDMSSAQKKARTLELISLVGINNPETRFRQYPHQLSGGMRQRIVIAMALACDPKILIADEPTTALDVTIQAQILDLMREIQKKSHTAIILITHNLGVVANMADRVGVMYGGKLVETANVRELFYEMKHPYTMGLLASIPKKGVKETLRSIPGSPPDLMAPPAGCPFAARCEYTMKVCQQYMPALQPLTPNHSCACWLLDDRAENMRKKVH